MTQADAIQTRSGWISPSETGWLSLDDFSVDELAERFGLPLWVISAAQIRQNVRDLSAALEASYPDAEVIYASKANPQPAIFALMSELGVGVDVVTMGHIRLALAGGVRPGDVIVNGNAKTSAELAWAVENGVRAINVDSVGEFHRIVGIAGTADTPVRLCLRLVTETDRHVDDAELLSAEPGKFGMTRDEALELVAVAKENTSVQVVGLHHHFGFTGAPADVTLGRHRNFVRQLVDTARDVERLGGRPLEILNVGGGLRTGRSDGFGPAGQTSFPTMQDYADATAGELGRLLRDRPLAGTPHMIVEAGGGLVANAAVLLATVCLEKAVPGMTPARWIFLEDTSAYHFVRRLMYDFHHQVCVASPRRPGALSAAIVAGPICTDDDIARGALLPPVEAGDVVAILDQGAYCEAITSDYCAVPIPAAVMLKDGHASVTRRRQALTDLVGVFANALERS